MSEQSPGNLAHDIVQGERSVEEARQFYADTIKAFMEGEQSEYMQGLIFDPPAQAEARDPDQTLFRKADPGSIAQSCAPAGVHTRSVAEDQLGLRLCHARARFP